jgi:hypothetical protein
LTEITSDFTNGLDVDDGISFDFFLGEGVARLPPLLLAVLASSVERLFFFFFGIFPNEQYNNTTHQHREFENYFMSCFHKFWFFAWSRMNHA